MIRGEKNGGQGMMPPVLFLGVVVVFIILTTVYQLPACYCVFIRYLVRGHTSRFFEGEGRDKVMIPASRRTRGPITGVQPYAGMGDRPLQRVCVALFCTSMQRVKNKGVLY